MVHVEVVNEQNEITQEGRQVDQGVEGVLLIPPPPQPISPSFSLSPGRMAEAGVGSDLFVCRGGNRDAQVLNWSGLLFCLPSCEPSHARGICWVEGAKWSCF